MRRLNETSQKPRPTRRRRRSTKSGATAAAEAVAPVARAWDTAARIGLGDRHLFEAANRCLAIVAEFVPPELSGSLRLLRGMVARGRCPGDDFADSAVRRGIDAAVAYLARGEP